MPEILEQKNMDITHFDVTEAAIVELEKYKKLEIVDIKSENVVRKSRQTVREVRIKIDKRRKELKAPLLERGRQIDSVAKQLSDRIVPIEKYLDDQISEANRQREERRLKREEEEKKRKAERDEILKNINEFVSGIFSHDTSIDDREKFLARLKAVKLTKKIFKDSFDEESKKLFANIKNGEDSISYHKNIAMQKAEQERIAAEQAEKEQEQKRIAEEQAAKEREQERLAEEQRKKEQEQAKIAAEQKELEEVQANVAAEQKTTKKQIKIDLEQLRRDREAFEKQQKAQNDLPAHGAANIPGHGTHAASHDGVDKTDIQKDKEILYQFAWHIKNYIKDKEHTLVSRVGKFAFKSFLEDLRPAFKALDDRIGRM